MDNVFSFCFQSELDYMWHVVRVYEPVEVHQDEISLESPLLLNCDFSPDGFRKLCTLHSSSLANVRTRSCSLMVPAGRNTCKPRRSQLKGREIRGWTCDKNHPVWYSESMTLSRRSY